MPAQQAPAQGAAAASAGGATLGAAAKKPPTSLSRPGQRLAAAGGDAAASKPPAKPSAKQGPSQQRSYQERRKLWRDRLEQAKAKAEKRIAAVVAGAVSAGGEPLQWAGVQLGGQPGTKRPFSRHVNIPRAANRPGSSHTTPSGSPRKGGTFQAQPPSEAGPKRHGPRPKAGSHSPPTEFLQTPHIWQGFEMAEAPSDFGACSEEDLVRFLRQAGRSPSSSSYGGRPLAGGELVSAAREARNAWEVERIMVACQWPQEVLRVTREAEHAALKAAYRRVSMQVHPDKNTAVGASDAMSIVADAFNMLALAGGRTPSTIPAFMRQNHPTRQGEACAAAGAGPQPPQPPPPPSSAGVATGGGEGGGGARGGLGGEGTPFQARPPVATSGAVDGGTSGNGGGGSVASEVGIGAEVPLVGPSATLSSASSEDLGLRGLSRGSSAAAEQELQQQGLWGGTEAGMPPYRSSSLEEGGWGLSQPNLSEGWTSQSSAEGGLQPGADLEGVAHDGATAGAARMQAGGVGAVQGERYRGVSTAEHWNPHGQLSSMEELVMGPAVPAAGDAGEGHGGGDGTGATSATAQGVSNGGPLAPPAPQSQPSRHHSLLMPQQQQAQPKPATVPTALPPKMRVTVKLKAPPPKK